MFFEFLQFCQDHEMVSVKRLVKANGNPQEFLLGSAIFCVFQGERGRMGGKEKLVFYYFDLYF